MLYSHQEIFRHILNLIQVTGLLPYLLKIPVYLRFSDIFKGDRKRQVISNMLILLSTFRSNLNTTKISKSIMSRYSISFQENKERKLGSKSKRLL